MNLYRIVETGFSASEMPPLAPDEAAFRVHGPLSDDEYRILAGHLAARPDAWLHLFDQSPDVECLRFFPGLRRLMVTNLRLVSWDGLRHVNGALEHLAMGDTTLRPVSIAPIGELASLRTLGLAGPVRDAESISRLQGIEELHLRSVTLSDLSPLLAMPRLRLLYLGLGGTADLSLLTDLPALEDLELWRIRGLRQLSVLGSLPSLRVLRLQSMSAITELPSMAGAAALKVLALDTMKGIRDLSPVAAAPALEELLLIDMPQLGPESLRPLVGHPTLRRGIWGFGSLRRNAAAYDVLPLGDPPYGHARWTESLTSRGEGGGDGAG